MVVNWDVRYREYGNEKLEREEVGTRNGNGKREKASGIERTGSSTFFSACAFVFAFVY